MKKIILVSLTAVILLCGCMGFASDYVPNSVISDSLIARMQHNMDTDSLEGFTHKSTFGDVLGSISVRDVGDAQLLYDSDLLGYPAVSVYSFSNNAGLLSLDGIDFAIMPDGAKDSDAQIEDIVAKMDEELGGHDGFGDEYYWEQDNCSMDLWVLGEGCYSSVSQDSNAIAVIRVSPGVVVMGVYPKCPALFPYPFGTDIQTVYQSETSGRLPKGFEYSASLDYEEEGIEISLRFVTDNTGSFRLGEGTYDVYLNGMGFKSSLDYFEALADGLVHAAGEPDARGYGIPDVDKDVYGIGFSYEITEGAQGLSAQDIRESGDQYYWLDIRWENICFRAEYFSDASITIDFSGGYIKGTGKE